MSDSIIATQMSVDVKKYRIRIFKSMLHEMGDPMNVQLLVNPNDMLVAIRSVEKKKTGDLTHSIGKQLLTPGASCDLYSRAFVTKLCEVSQNMQEGHSYRLSGKIIPAQKISVFFLNTIEEIES